MPRSTKAQRDLANLTTIAGASLGLAIDNLAQAARAVMPIGIMPANVYIEIAHALENARRAKARLEIFERSIPGAKKKRK